MKNLFKLFLIFSFSFIFFFQGVSADYIISDTSTLKSDGGNSVLVTDKSGSWPDLTWQAQDARWIWNAAKLSQEDALSGETEIFSKFFRLSSVPSSATIYYYYDNGIKIKINDQEVVSDLSPGDSGRSGFTKDHSKRIESYLKEGDNVIVFTVRNYGASAGAWKANKAGFVYYIDIDPSLVGPGMSGFLTASNCSIPAGGSSCSSSLGWSTTNPVGTSAVTTPTNITVKTANTSTATYTVSYGSRNFYLYNNAMLLSQATATASCADGTSWNSTNNKCETIVEPSSGSLTASNCLIPAGGSSCSSSLNWSTTNPVGTSAVTTPTNITVKTANTSTATYTVSYGSRTFYLYNNGTLLDQDHATASCTSGTSWNGSTCQANSVPVVTLTANPTSGTVGTVNPTLTWTVSGSATSCTATGDWSGTKSTSGGSQSMGVLNTVKTYVYNLYCSNASGNSNTDTVTVLVNSLPPEDSLDVALVVLPKDSIKLGEEVMLEWSASMEGSFCSIPNPEIEGEYLVKDQGYSGNTGLFKPQKTNIYNVYCRNGSLEAEASVKINVDDFKPIFIER